MFLVLAVVQMALCPCYQLVDPVLCHLHHSIQELSNGLHEDVPGACSGPNGPVPLLSAC